MKRVVAFVFGNGNEEKSVVARLAKIELWLKIGTTTLFALFAELGLLIIGITFGTTI